MTLNYKPLRQRKIYIPKPMFIISAMIFITALIICIYTQFQLAWLREDVRYYRDELDMSYTAVMQLQDKVKVLEER